MSAETIEWLGANSLIGFTDKRGFAWHYREGHHNHFPEAIPRKKVIKLLSYPLAETSRVDSVVHVLTDDGVEERVFPTTNWKGIVRLDTGETFRYFKPTYQIHQPVEWCVRTLDRLMYGQLQLSSAIVLKGGAVTAVQAEFADTRVAGSTGAEPVKHRPYVTAATSHNGDMSTTFLRGTRIWVCDNTLAGALAESSALRHKVKHSSQSLSRISEVREDLDVAVEEVGDAVDLAIRELTSQHVSNSTFNAVVDAYTGESKAKEGRGKTIAGQKTKILKDLWKKDERVAPWKNSAWGVLAAFNTADHHIFGTDATRVSRNESRALSGERDKFDENILRLLASV